MGFRREVHHMGRTEGAEHAVQLLPVADIDLFETESGVLRHLRQIFQIARIGEFIHRADRISGIFDNMPDHCGSDESRAARDKNSIAVHFHPNLSCCFLSAGHRFPGEFFLRGSFLYGGALPDRESRSAPACRNQEEEPPVSTSLPDRRTPLCC